MITFQRKIETTWNLNGLNLRARIDAVKGEARKDPKTLMRSGSTKALQKNLVLHAGGTSTSLGCFCTGRRLWSVAIRRDLVGERFLGYATIPQNFILHYIVYSIYEFFLQNYS